MIHWLELFHGESISEKESGAAIEMNPSMKIPSRVAQPLHRACQSQLFKP